MDQIKEIKELPEINEIEEIKAKLNELMRTQEIIVRKIDHISHAIDRLSRGKRRANQTEAYRRQR